MKEQDIILSFNIRISRLLLRNEKDKDLKNLKNLIN